MARDVEGAIVGVHLTGSLREGVTATDLALTITQMLRKAKVVGKFVEFYGPGASALPVVDRATIARPKRRGGCDDSGPAETVEQKVARFLAPLDTCVRWVTSLVIVRLGRLAANYGKPLQSARGMR